MQQQEITHKGITFVPYIKRSDLDKETDRVAQEISNQYRDKFPMFIGILNGAFMWTADLVRKLDFSDCTIDFAKVSSYQGLQSSQEIKQLIGAKQSIKGRHVILVEDIIDTGITMSKLIPELLKQEPLSLKIACLFVKRDCMKIQIPIDFVGIEIKPQFIIGYGIDYDEFGRTLNDVWIKKE